MHALRSAAAFMLASLFFISLYITINAFTFGDKVQAEGIKSFLVSEMTGAKAPENCRSLCSAQLDANSCSLYCSTQREADRPSCLKMCEEASERSQDAIDVCAQNCVENFDETQDVFSKSVDDIYSKSLIYGITVSGLTRLFSQKMFFLVLTILLCAAVFLLDDNPAKRLGGGLVMVAVSLLSVVAVPVFVSGGENFALSLLSNYLLDSIIIQAIAGASLLAVGIILEYTGKKKQ